MSRKTILIATLAVIGLMALLPPWTETFPLAQLPQSYQLGYALVFAPPQPRPGYVLSIDVLRLVAQFLVVGCAGGIAAAIARK